MKTYNVGYLVGSLAKDSINRKLAHALIKLAPEQLKFTEILPPSCRSTATTTTPITRKLAATSRRRSSPPTRS